MTMSFTLMLIIIVILFTLFLMKGHGEVRRKSSSTNKRFILLYGYVGVLLAATIVSLFLPSDGEGEFVDIREIERADGKLYNDIHAGRISSVDNKYIVEQREISLPKDRLVLQNFDQNQPLWFVVERVEENVQSEMWVIKSRVIANSIDLSDMFDPLSVTIEGEKMKITPRTEQKVVMGVMEQGFPFYLFSDKSRFGMSHNYTSMSDQFIYLRVPKRIEIVYDENQIYLHEVENEM